MRGHLRFLLVFLAMVAIGTMAAQGQDRSATSNTNSPTSLFGKLQERIMGGILSPVAEPAHPPRSAQTQQAQSNHTIDPRAQALPSSTVLPRYSRSGLPSPTNRPAMVSRSPRVETSARPEANQEAASTVESSPSGGTNRLYERLGAARRSSFGDLPPARQYVPSPQVEASRAAAPETIARETRTPARPLADTSPTLAPRRQPSAATSVLSQPELSVAARSRPITRQLATPREVSLPAPAVSQPVVEKELPSAVVEEELPSENIVASPTVSTPPAKPAAAQGRVLFAQRSPVLNVSTTGPRRIDVGRESVYRVSIENAGGAVADQLIVGIDFPQWADVLGAEVSVGATTTASTADGTQRFQWKVGRLAPKTKETLVLRVVPRESRPFDLAVVWDYTPEAATAKIEVQEPKIELKLDGPSEVLFGRKETFRLEIVNTGTGDAREVILSLLPLGSGQNVPATHPIGTLAAGKKKVVEIELTARQAGNLQVNVDATADGGVRTHLTQEVIVLRPALVVNVDAPEFQFVGNDVIYRIDVSNPGTAAADTVALTARLPQGFEYISSTPEGSISVKDGEVTWKLAGLPAKKDVAIELLGRLTKEGTGELQLVCSAADGLKAQAKALVRIEAIADLALETTDPAGPIPVGSEATYEVKVTNRGSKRAEAVEVIAYFSDGIEPIKADGGKYRLAPGQVVFDALETLAAGESHVFTINTRASTAGNHVFRAEIFCEPLGTRLVSEETTHYYGRTRVSKPTTPPVDDGILTADRRDESL